ncbi:hypothetical protein [Myxococcus stipitatus]|uniref:hypothetical protein n=1 Tax=Myxococcus stipitatus TaxID=83455 RepID=UPI0030D03FF0
MGVQCFRNNMYVWIPLDGILYFILGPDSRLATGGGLRPSVPDLPPHQHWVEIDAPEIRDDLDDTEIHQRMRDLRAQFKVDPVGKRFVARKPPGA